MDKDMLPRKPSKFLLWFAAGAMVFGLSVMVTNLLHPAADPHIGYQDIALSDLVGAVKSAEQKDIKANFYHYTGSIDGGVNPNTKERWIDFVEIDLPGKKIRTSLQGPDEAMIKALLTNDATVKNTPLFETITWVDRLFSWDMLTGLIVFALIIVWLFSARSGGARGMLDMVKSRARRWREGKRKVTLADVAGIDDAKDDLMEIVEFLRDPAKFQRLGGRVPRGVLLVGPPGTGKTLLARAIAGEAGVPFFTISGSDFVEMFVGVGAGRVRDMFADAKKNAPCIIFVDEIDAVGKKRNSGNQGNDEREQTLNQLLVEMDGFEANESVILIAATNRPDVLDNALMRPGRFDRQIQVPNPDFDGREAILKVHARNVPLAKNVDLKVVARGTPQFSGADLMNLVNEAALLAGRKGKDEVDASDFDEAKDKILMGAKRRGLMTEDDRRLTAYHEGGHALMTVKNLREHPDADVEPIHKATIVPRGRALGMVQQLPTGDRVSYSLEYMLARLEIIMGGRAAEEIVFGEENVTSGAQSDIQAATEMSRRMVKNWGFSEELGPVALSESYNVSEPSTLANATKGKIDRGILALNDDALNVARVYLSTHRHELDLLAAALLKYETLSGEEVELVIAGKNIRQEAQGNAA
jgi:cell division protease FtsH